MIFDSFLFQFQTLQKSCKICVKIWFQLPGKSFYSVVFSEKNGGGAKSGPQYLTFYFGGMNDLRELLLGEVTLFKFRLDTFVEILQTAWKIL